MIRSKYDLTLANYAREFRMTYTREINDHFRDAQLGALVVQGKVEKGEDHLELAFSIGGEDIKVLVPLAKESRRSGYAQMDEMLIRCVVAVQKRLGLDEDEDE